MQQLHHYLHCGDSDACTFASLAERPKLPISHQAPSYQAHASTTLLSCSACSLPQTHQNPMHIQVVLITFTTAVVLRQQAYNTAAFQFTRGCVECAGFMGKQETLGTPS